MSDGLDAQVQDPSPIQTIFWGAVAQETIKAMLKHDEMSHRTIITDKNCQNLLDLQHPSLSFLFVTGGASFVSLTFILIAVMSANFWDGDEGATTRSDQLFLQNELKYELTIRPCD